MRPLPPDLDMVFVPEFVGPSALGRWGGCRLKLMASSREWKLDRLAAGPMATIGTLVHRVFERWAWEPAHATDAASIFEEEYERLRQELIEDPDRCHFADFHITRTVQEWFRLKALVLSRCTEATKLPRLTSSHKNRMKGAQGIEPAAIPVGSAWHEFPLKSRSLRLRGQADLIRRTGSHAYEIRDYKSGAILDEDGSVKEEVAIQLQAYGLMLLERAPDSTVTLVVDNGSEHAVAFEGQAREDAVQRITSLLEGFDAGMAVRATEVAQPGAGCSGCNIRHTCTAYKRVARHWWAEYPQELERIPKDTWGAVAAIRSLQQEAHVMLEDDARRRVHVDALHKRHGLSNIHNGRRLFFFDLASTGVGIGFDGRKYHSRGFYELPRDRRERRAWTTQVFEQADESRGDGESG